MEPFISTGEEGLFLTDTHVTQETFSNSQQSTCGLISLKNRGLPALNFVSESHNQTVYSCNTAITFLFLPSHFPSNTLFTSTRHVE